MPISMFLRCTYLLLVVNLIIFTSCKPRNRSDKKLSAADSAALEEQKHLPENALRDLWVTEGLEVQAMATEPLLKNPTNIDVDERGRVWVTEAYNYRPGINGNPVDSAGDRIIIL